MSGDHDVGRPPLSARWRVTVAVLTTVLAAAACTTRGGIQQPTTSIQTTGVPAATSNGGTQAGDIWVMHADGSNRRQVTKTRDPAVDFDPSLSPDGRRVVFRTSRGRYAPDPNGTGIRSLPQLQGAGDPIDWLARVG
jgi:hypothetical protein